MRQPITGNLTPNAQALVDHWSEIRGNDLVPVRSMLRPKDILHLLPALMLLEYRDPGVLVYRLAGTEIVERLGVDFTGMNLFDHIAPHQKNAAVLRFDMLRTQPCGMALKETLHSKHGTCFTAEVIYLPLRNHEGQITQLVSLATVLERGEKETIRKIESGPMKAVAACFFDIGAGVPEEAFRSGFMAARA